MSVRESTRHTESHTTRRGADLQEPLKRALGERLHRSDCREAAMVVAQQHPELVAEGYDLDTA